jgi:hypothetical protein
MLHLSMDTRVKVSIFIPQEVENSIKREANEQNISFSSLASDYLELGVKTRQELGLTELLGPNYKQPSSRSLEGWQTE